MRQENNQKDLLELITKVISRNIQRNRETGFTLYAVLFVTFYLLFELLDLSLSFNEELNQKIILGTIILNSIFCLSFPLLGSRVSGRGPLSTKIFENDEESFFEYVLAVLVLVPILISNVVAQDIAGQFNLPRFYFILFGSLAGLNILSPFIILIFKKWRNRGVNSIEFTYFGSKIRSGISWGSGLYFVVLLAISLYLILGYDLNVLNVEEYPQVIKFALFVQGLFIAPSIINDLNQKKSIDRNLEDLEAEIYLKNLSDSEIKSRLEDEYMGILFPHWLERKKESLLKALEEFKGILFSLEPELEKLNKLDKKEYPYEYTARSEKLLKAMEDENAKLLNLYEELKTHIKRIKRWSSINDDELEQLIKFEIEISNNIKAFREDINTLAKKYDSI